MKTERISYRLVYTPVGLTYRRVLRSSVESDVISIARILPAECEPVVVKITENTKTTEEVLNWREK